MSALLNHHIERSFLLHSAADAARFVPHPQTQKKWGRLFFAIDLAFMGTFGWLLPLLANWR